MFSVNVFILLIELNSAVFAQMWNLHVPKTETDVVKIIGIVVVVVVNNLTMLWTSIERDLITTKKSESIKKYKLASFKW